jgi:6-phosphogluconate dehydrogenase
MISHTDDRSIAMIGLGRMGANMARRLARAGMRVHGFDADPNQCAALAGERGVSVHESLGDAVAAARSDGAAGGAVAWLMLPAGAITESAIDGCRAAMGQGDVLVEGGNSNYLDSQRRAQAAGAVGLRYVDCGVSGGVWGLENGYCLSLGGSADAVARLLPFVQALAPTPEAGWLHCGPSGAGHFVKMIHNGIEYGMMQSIAEGFALLAGREELGIDLAAVGRLWQHGSVVRSWLLELTADALARPGALESVAPVVADSGEGRWTVDEAVRQGTPAMTIAAALMSRFDSQGRADTGNRLLALMRKGFGGHPVVPGKP